MFLVPAASGERQAMTEGSGRAENSATELQKNKKAAAAKRIRIRCRQGCGREKKKSKEMCMCGQLRRPDKQKKMYRCIDVWMYGLMYVLK